MRYILLVLPFVDRHGPCGAVLRGLEEILVHERCAEPGELVAVMFGEVDLHRVNRAEVTEIDLQPFACASRCGGPIVAHVLVHGFRRFEAGKRRGCGYRFSVGKKHPAGEWIRPGVPLPFRQTGGVIGESGIAEKNTLSVEAGREKSDATLIRLFYRDPHGGDVPEIAVDILESAAVAGSGDEPARFEREGTIGGVGKRSERAARGVD